MAQDRLETGGNHARLYPGRQNHRVGDVPLEFRRLFPAAFPRDGDLEPLLPVARLMVGMETIHHLHRHRRGDRDDLHGLVHDRRHPGYVRHVPYARRPHPYQRSG